MADVIILFLRVVIIYYILGNTEKIFDYNDFQRNWTIFQQQILKQVEWFYKIQEVFQNIYRIEIL